MADAKNTGIDAKMRKYMEILSIIHQQAEKRDDLFIIGTHLVIHNFQNLLTNADVAINRGGTGLELILSREFLCVSESIFERISWDYNDREIENLIKKISEGGEIEERILAMDSMEVAFVFCKTCLKTGDYFFQVNNKIQN